MCYLPLPLLKAFVGIGAVLSALLSVGMLIAVIYLNLDYKDIIDKADEPVIKTLIVVCYILSILFLLLALCGLFGSIKAKRKNKLAPCLLTMYLISVVFFFFVFISVTIVLFAAPPAIFGSTCEKGSSTKLIQSLKNISDDADKKFCTDSCPCFFEKQNVQSFLWNYLVLQKKNVTNESTIGHRNYRNCTNTIQQQENGILLEALEGFLNCSGWCPTDSFAYLRFSDINYCVTDSTYQLMIACLKSKGTCYEQFKNLMVNKGNVMGIFTAVASAITFISMIFVCCICTHPQTRSNKSKNFYARMMDAE